MEEEAAKMTEAELLELGELIEKRASAGGMSDDAQLKEPEPEPEYHGPPGGDPYLLERMDRLRSEFREEQLRKDFEAADTDGSGAIDRQEFTRLMWKLQGSMSDAEIQQQLDIVDSDGDGEISFAEFRVWWTSEPMEILRKQHRARLGIAEDWDPGDVERRMAVKRAELEEARLVRTFKSVDTDGSGEIELDEWIVLMRKMAPHLPIGSVEWTFKCIDVDCSGAIDFGEFKGWWYSEEGLALRGEPSRKEQEAARLAGLRKKFEHELAAAEATRKAKQEYEAQMAREQHTAAARLQAAARGRQQRVQRELEQRAASKLQALFRGRRGRGTVARLKGEAFDEGVRNARDFHISRMKARQQAAQFLGLPPPVSPLVEVAAMKRNVLGQLWMEPGRKSPEKMAAVGLERKLYQDYRLLQKSASATMERYDYDKWKRGSKIEQHGLWEEVDELKMRALLAEEEKRQCWMKEKQRAQRLSRLEAIMSRATTPDQVNDGEYGEMREPSWVKRGSNVSLGRRPSIQAAQRELESARILRPRWKAGAAVSQYRANKPTVFGERRPNAEAAPHELAAELANRSNLSFDGSWASVPASCSPYCAETTFSKAEYIIQETTCRHDMADVEFVPIDSSHSTPDLRVGDPPSSVWRISSTETDLHGNIDSAPGSTSIHWQQDASSKRPRSAGGIESSSRLYSAFMVGTRRRCSTTSFQGSEAERAVWLQERAKCSMRVGARPLSASVLRQTSTRLARPPSAEKQIPQIVLEQTGIQMSGEDIERFVR